MAAYERELHLVNGLYRVDLHGKTLNAMRDLPIYCLGDSAVAAMDEQGLSGTVAVYRDGILARSYREPWHIQLEMIEEENAKMQREDPSWRIIAPPNAATAIEVAKAVSDSHHGINILKWYTRVGDGSLVAGAFNILYPRVQDGAVVSGGWDPNENYSVVGVLPLVVPTSAVGR